MPKHKVRTSISTSAWVCTRDDDLYVLIKNVHLWMYASTVLCAYVHPIPDAAFFLPQLHTPAISPSFFSLLGGDTSMGILVATQDSEYPPAWMPSCALAYHQAFPKP